MADSCQANKPYGTFYVGVTSNLIKRVYEHKHEITGGFTKKYRLQKLVYYELHSDPENAILREKRIKRWKRPWKVKLIEEKNPNWVDLYEILL